MVEGDAQGNSYFQDQNVATRDLEERQRILKDRLVLIGQNLIDLKEKNQEELLELKKDVEILKQNTERIKSFLETISSEFSTFARKDDLNILIKQSKMFQPLESLEKESLEKLKNN